VLVELHAVYHRTVQRGVFRFVLPLKG